MTIEDAIENALFGSVRDLRQVDRTAWPNVSFAPPTDPYVRVDHLPNGNQRLFIQGTAPHLYLGILQLTVVAPLNAGPTEARAIASRIADAYPADRYISYWGVNLRIQKAPDVGRAFANDADWNVVVSVPYEVLAMPSDPHSLDFTKISNSFYYPLV